MHLPRLPEPSSSHRRPPALPSLIPAPTAPPHPSLLSPPPHSHPSPLSSPFPPPATPLNPHPLPPLLGVTLFLGVANEPVPAVHRRAAGERFKQPFRLSSPLPLPRQVSLFFSESPTNPYLRCIDVPLVSGLCHARGALVCIDGTFATPINQHVLPLGADLVLHSGTKYLAGHNDVSHV
ncbi:unnamed protein product [Closterium sp. NIES-54]